MRNITESELLSVYGGEIESEIVVEAPRRFDYSIYQNSDGSFGSAAYADSFAKKFGQFIEGIAGEAAAELLLGESDETKVHATFNPDGSFPFTTQEGYPAAIKDGKLFVDTDKDGKYDIVFSKDSTGNVFYSDGDGNYFQPYDNYVSNENKFYPIHPLQMPNF